MKRPNAVTPPPSVAPPTSRVAPPAPPAAPAKPRTAALSSRVAPEAPGSPPRPTTPPATSKRRGAKSVAAGAVDAPHTVAPAPAAPPISMTRVKPAPPATSTPAPPALAPPAPPAPPTPAPPTPDHDRGGTSGPNGREAGPKLPIRLAEGSDASGQRGGADGRSAKSALRAAARRRRRVEQQEARRFTERSRRRRLTWIVSLGALAALVLVVLFTAYSPVFAVRAITVQGTSRIDAAQVQSALADQVGKPLALVDFGRMESELAGFPLIQSYSTESSLPNTLIVRIVERQPVAQITAAAGGFDLIDPAGVVVSHSDARQAGFPVIDTAASAVGSAGFIGATAVLRAMPADLLAKVDTISAATPDSVSFTLSGAGQKVVWGSDANSTLKAKVLDKLIGTQDAEKSLTYDVSSPESPVVSG
ncbi:hypothetical protein B7R21_08125 [Subtercola boreus]|uniref:POTRA domain-containing protein n=1 Tax=Subtercola boreus TaxID=120213 RepID=A0A3E0VUP9_9MICO|nr:FtsQ-type POTRA domain-containing protein [Subtercola boreus]RFA13325.1 hypothetical protein B7R21_08125 [Subtercola boreus]